MHILVVEHDAQLVQASLIRPDWGGTNRAHIDQRRVGSGEVGSEWACPVFSDSEQGI